MGEVWLLVVIVVWEDDEVVLEEVVVTGVDGEELEVETDVISEEVLGEEVGETEVETMLEVEGTLAVVVMVVEGLVAK